MGTSLASTRLGVVGAGPAGLVAAIVARSLGLDVLVLEQAGDFGRVGGGIMIHSNGLRVLEALGLREALEARGRMTQLIRVEDPAGRVLSTFDYRRLDIPINRGAVILRATLLEVLLEAARARGVEIRFGARCTSVTNDACAATVEIEDGSHERFDVLIACDGINSRIRDAAGLTPKRRTIGEAYLRGVAPVAIANSTIREVWGARGRRFGICPLSDSSVYFYCNAPLGRWTETLASGLDRFVDGWSDFGDDVRSILAAVTDWSRVNYSELTEIVLDRWYVRRVFVTGDAAHAMTPNLGQGANSAMVDALVVVRLVADALAMATPIESAGPTYERIRKPFVTKTQTTARQVGEIAAWSSFLSRLLRSNLLATIDRLDSLSRPGLLLGAGYNPLEQVFFERIGDMGEPRRPCSALRCGGRSRAGGPG